MLLSAIVNIKKSLGNVWLTVELFFKKKKEKAKDRSRDGVGEWTIRQGLFSL